MPTDDLTRITHAQDPSHAGQHAADMAATSTFYKAGADSTAEAWGFAVVDLLVRAGWQIRRPGSPTDEQSAEALAHAVHLLRPSDHYPVDVDPDQVLLMAHRFARFMAGHPDEKVAIVPLESLRDLLGLTRGVVDLDTEALANIGRLDAIAWPDQGRGTDMDEEPF